jgi:hypothetical protein
MNRSWSFQHLLLGQLLSKVTEVTGFVESLLFFLLLSSFYWGKVRYRKVITSVTNNTDTPKATGQKVVKKPVTLVT